MRSVDLIAKKRDGIELEAHEIEFLINGYSDGSIPDYQMSAFAMACYFKGLTERETSILTNAMVKTGIEMSIPGTHQFIVDKHSTGGVGDKTTLALGPLLSSFGITIAKMSGRGLGHTGGTIDKLESIPGFDVNLSSEKFLKQLEDIHFAVIGQTNELVPVDKKLYALRDVTATTNIMGLIASSIMSKKLAIKSDLVVLDVKCGDGAFMTNIASAEQLCKLMSRIAKDHNRQTLLFITDMGQPLGKAIGNKLEVLEAMDTLHNKGPEDFTTLVKQITASVLVKAKKVIDKAQAFKLIEEKINSGEAFVQFEKFVKHQNGNLTKMIWAPKFKKEIFADQNGFLKITSALIFGEVSMKLGAGRLKYDDKIDYDAGILLNKKTGDKIGANDLVMTLFSNQPISDQIVAEIKSAFSIQNQKEQSQIILKVIEN